MVDILLLVSVQFEKSVNVHEGYSDRQLPHQIVCPPLIGLRRSDAQSSEGKLTSLREDHVTIDQQVADLLVCCAHLARVVDWRMSNCLTFGTMGSVTVSVSDQVTETIN